MKLLQNWKKLYGYMLPYAPSFWWGMVTTLIGIIILHFSNYYLRHFVDALGSGDRDLAWQSLLIIVVSYFIAQVLTYIGQMWESNWNGSWDAIRKVHKKLFVHLQDLDFAFHSNKSSGALMSIIKQGENAFLRMGVEFHFQVVPTVLEVFVVGYFLFGFSSAISLIFGGSMVIFFAFITWFGWTQHIARKKLRQAYYRVDSIQVENLTNFDTVKFFSQEKKRKRKILCRYRCI